MLGELVASRVLRRLKLFVVLLRLFQLPYSCSFDSVFRLLYLLTQSVCKVFFFSDARRRRAMIHLVGPVVNLRSFGRRVMAYFD